MNFAASGTFCHFLAEKWDFYRVTDSRLIFENKQYTNDVKKTHLTFIEIFSKSNGIFIGLVEDVEVTPEHQLESV